MRKSITFAFAAFLLPSVSAAAQEQDRKPEAFKSIASTGQMPSSDGGPLFRRSVRIFEEVLGQSQAKLEAFAVPQAHLNLSQFEGSELKHSRFDEGTIRAANASCLGPFAVDEGKTWVQLAWICDTAADAAIAKHMRFSDSPELSLTVWFEGDQIHSLQANEPLSVPMAKRLRMDAYQLMKKGN